MFDLNSKKGKIFLAVVILLLLLIFVYIIIFKGFKKDEESASEEKGCKIEKIEDGITLCAKHEYGNNWEYEVTGTLPNICHLIELEYTPEGDFPPSSMEFILKITPPGPNQKCLEGLRDIQEKGGFKMDKEGSVSLNVLTSSDFKSVYIDESKSVTLNVGDIVVISAQFKSSTGYSPFYPEFDRNFLEMVRFEDRDEGNGLMGGDLTVRTYFFRVSGSTTSTKLRVGAHQAWNSEATKEVQKEADIEVVSQVNTSD